MNRTKRINALIQANGYKSYLEIGLGNGANFRKVNCLVKCGVDPVRKGIDKTFVATSDQFFKENQRKFDIIFIDGLHTAEQVERDIINSWEVLREGGVILLHDIMPLTEESQLVPKKSSPWKGDVWRAHVGFIKKYYPEISCYTTGDDTGLGFIWKNEMEVKEGFIDKRTTYEAFSKQMKALLRLVCVG